VVDVLTGDPLTSSLAGKRLLTRGRHRDSACGKLSDRDERHTLSTLPLPKNRKLAPALKKLKGEIEVKILPNIGFISNPKSPSLPVN
jgi:hypothetical protein